MNKLREITDEEIGLSMVIQDSTDITQDIVTEAENAFNLKATALGIEITEDVSMRDLKAKLETLIDISETLRKFSKTFNLGLNVPNRSNITYDEIDKLINQLYNDFEIEPGSVTKSMSDKYTDINNILNKAERYGISPIEKSLLSTPDLKKWRRNMKKLVLRAEELNIDLGSVDYSKNKKSLWPNI